jgi:two-component system phosphate regulon sensor histidine kinase PhoR
MKRKDTYLTSFSILFVVSIFILQALLVHKLYESNLSVLGREMNVVVDQAHSLDLGERMKIRRADVGADKNSVPKFVGANKDVEDHKIDTTKTTHRIDGRMASQELKDDYVALMKVGMEQYIANYYPFDVHRMDSIISIVLHKHNLDVDYCVLVIDTATNKFDQISEPNFDVASALLVSKDIPLDFLQSKVIRLVANPSNKFFKEVAWMLFLSLALSLFCIYCLYYQLRTLFKQRTLLKLKNDFFSDVSHEFKQPLSTLSQAICLLQNEQTIHNPDKLASVIKISLIEIARMNEKTEMVLSMAKHDEGIFELNYQYFDLVKLVYNLADEAISTPSKSVDVDIDNELTDPLAYADETHIEQVVSNLLGNAVKYSNQYVEIKIKLYRDNNNIFISVKDNGFGISKENQQVIFNKYSRVDKDSSIKGHGIGLNYIKRIVEKHNGDITLISEPGIGSEFIVRLPQPNKG